MSIHPPDTGAWASAMIRNILGLAAWTAAWVASLALARFGPDIVWNNEPVPTLVAIVFNVFVGVGMLFANKRYLNSLDELQRAIQIQAMAWSLGAGLVGGLAWTLLARHDLVGIEAEIAHLVIFMGVVYMAGCIAGVLRYR